MKILIFEVIKVANEILSCELTPRTSVVVKKDTWHQGIISFGGFQYRLGRFEEHQLAKYKLTKFEFPEQCLIGRFLLALNRFQTRAEREAMACIWPEAVR